MSKSKSGTMAFFEQSVAAMSLDVLCKWLAVLRGTSVFVCEICPDAPGTIKATTALTGNDFAIPRAQLKEAFIVALHAAADHKDLFPEETPP
jgi:hypothetical protein